MPTKACIFCGGRPLTREHVYPLWMSEYLRTLVKYEGGFGFGTKQYEAPFGTPDDIRERMLVHPKVINNTARCVCADCNGGWMREIEEAAAEHLRPMIRGSLVQLTVEAQKSLSAWIALRAMIIQYAHPGQDEIRDDWLKWMYETGTPPPGWRAWVSGYSGSVPIFYEARTITVHSSEFRGKPSDDPTAHHGLVTSFGVGHVAIKVVGLDRFTLGNPRADYLVPIHPSPNVALQWPPRYYFTDDTIERYVVMFMPGGTTAQIANHIRD